MIKKINIENFKSIKLLDFEANKVNIFIGEPNSGKSNLLEALGVFCVDNYDNIKDLVRYKQPDNLFFDNDINLPVLCKADEYKYSISFKHNKFDILGEFETESHPLFDFWINYNGAGLNSHTTTNKMRPFRYYKFRATDTFSASFPSFLRVPYGDNLFSILRSNAELKNIVTLILKDKGYRLNLRTGENTIELVKDEEDILYSYPFTSVSDTLQRLIFYISAIESNVNAALLLEEPEANTFPFYTKFLAEKISLDKTNQYFIVTHNPYFLLSLVEKTAMHNLNVFVTYMENYQTKVKKLTENQLSELMTLNSDVFFNLDTFIQ